MTEVTKALAVVVPDVYHRFEVLSADGKYLLVDIPVDDIGARRGSEGSLVVIEGALAKLQLGVGKALIL